MAGGGGRTQVVMTLGITQTLAWASTYYLPAILAIPMARDLSLPKPWVFGMFTVALLTMGAAAPLVGREIDRRGGRIVLTLSNIVSAAGLALLASAQGPVVLAVAWIVLGIGMAMGLYDAAFAALAHFYGVSARGPITGITLMAGFASTIGWPVTAALEAAYGWRAACLIWAAVHVLICFPLNWSLLPPGKQKTSKQERVAPELGTLPSNSKLRAMLLLSFMFSAAWFVTGAMATHLPNLLQEMGASATAAIAAAALVGPAQVASRLIEFSLLRHVHPLMSAALAVGLHPIGAGILFLVGGPAAAAFSVLHGAGNGLLTIASGTLPLALFGSAGYGLRQGLIGVPARLTQATSPFLFGLIISASPVAAIAVSSGLMLIALIALLLLRRQT